MTKDEQAFHDWWARNYKGIDLESDPLRKADMFLAWTSGIFFVKKTDDGN